MNNTQRQNANLAAAKLLGLDVVDDREIVSDHSCVPLRLGKEALGFFDIFTNPADCLNVVKMLSSKHCIDIVSSIVGVDSKFIGWGYYRIKDDVFREPFDTYEDTVAYACLEIGEKDD